MLRKLKKEDAPLMMEWMNDDELNQFFKFKNTRTELDRIIDFIEKSQDFTNTQHYAIVDDNDEYLGTISLKNINYEDKNAEYAISLRKKCIGTGVARQATEEIIRIAFNNLGLNKIYLNVLKNNLRAIKFYKKMGFQYEGTSKSHIRIGKEFIDIEWYAIFKEDL